MPIAALYDIHSNLPALEAVVEEIRGLKPDAIVIGGDVFPGPMPRETLEYLLNLEIPLHFLRGNGDREVLARMRDKKLEAIPEQFRDLIRWVAQGLTPEHEAVIAAWPETLTISIPSLGDVLFCHATPRSDTEIFTRLTAEDRLRPIFAIPNVPTIVCGHTHMQFDRRIGQTRVVNSGSVGMPFGAPGADWLLLGPNIEFRHTPYNLEKAADRIRNTSYPQAQQFAAHNVLQPPSEEQQLKAFGGVEL